MNQVKQLASKQGTIGDAAVDGLLGGVGAGVVMAVFLIIMVLISGDDVAGMLARFDPSARSPVVGTLMHLAVAGVYGVAFGVLWRLIPGRWHRPLPTLILGIAYGFLLLLLAERVILPGTRSPLLAIPLAPFGAAHVLYGLSLGWLIGRTQKSREDIPPSQV